MERFFDVIVVGGGAAGLFCAIEAGRRGRSVAVLECNPRVGAKIAISGGGRCNFTNLRTAPENFLSDNPDFCRSALSRFTPRDFVARVERRCIAYHEKAAGQLFCDGSSRQIIEMLRSECAATAVEIHTNCRISGVDRADRFQVHTDRGVLGSRSLVVATGGLSIPKLGASDFAYLLARRFGLSVIPPRPGLVPLTLGEPLLSPLRDLSGVSFPAGVRCGRVEFRDSVLVTHRGLSGPAILQISSYWRPAEPVDLDLFPEPAEDAAFVAERQTATQLATVLGRHLPSRLARTWCTLESPSKPMNQLSAREFAEVVRRLHRWRIVPSGSEGFGKAEVTAGGIDTRELSSKTMEVARVPGLFCIGEAVDVTGHLGGYNFQWAWASAYAAGQHV